MSATQTRPERKQEAVDTKSIRAMPVVEAVKYAFSLPRTRGAIILGPPGIGKTENVLRFAEIEARKLGKTPVNINEERSKRTYEEYVELLKDIIKNPQNYYVITMVPFGATMPDDLLGVPNLVKVKDGSKVLAVFEESALKGSLALLTIKDIYGVLIIDDAMNAFDNVRRSFIQAVFQERLVGGFNGVKLSPNVRVIATGNLTSESELATPLQKPMVGRAWIGYAKPESLESWYRRMEIVTNGKWYKEVYAFLKRYENYYNNVSLMDEEIPTAPVPRSWSALAVDFASPDVREEIEKLLKDKEEGSQRLIQRVAGYVGVEAATQFVAFITKPVVAVEDVIKNPKLLNEMTKDMDLTFRFAVQLGDKLDKLLKEGKDVYKYLGVMVDLMDKTTEDIGVFIYEMLSDNAKRELKRITKTGLVSKDPKKKVIAKRIRELIVNLAVADVLLDM